MADTYVALLRGINVGRAKRVAMADLRAIVAGLGFSGVCTLLNSGNVVFSASGIDTAEAARRIEEALAARLGVAARVTALSAAELAEAIDGNPLRDIGTDASRLLVAFLADPADRRLLRPLTGQDWSPEALAVGRRVAYLWCPQGVVASPLAQAVGRALGDAVTTRNWATALKLKALADNAPC